VALASDPTTDRQLKASDIQQSSSPDAVAALFAGLGYKTSARLKHSPAAMGITAHSIRRKLRRIELIADQETGTLQVYLAELDSATVAARQGLARALRDRAGDYLLVVTSDYEALDNSDAVCTVAGRAIIPSSKRCYLHHRAILPGMGMPRALTLRLESSDYERLAAEANRLGMSPGTLARVYVRAGLAGNGDTAEERRRLTGLAALEGLAALRARLPQLGSVDVVKLVREGRKDLARRTAP
jgi:hypothetical protein